MLENITFKNRNDHMCRVIPWKVNLGGDRVYTFFFCFLVTALILLVFPTQNHYLLQLSGSLAIFRNSSNQASKVKEMENSYRSAF